jgi:ParB/RepB/Spo0J family partition protein
MSDHNQTRTENKANDIRLSMNREVDPAPDRGANPQEAQAEAGDVMITTPATTTTITTARVADIEVGDRHRKDLGDLASLRESLQGLGMLQPLVITSTNNLVAGYRRLVAAKELGWESVPVHVVHNLDDALLLLRAEYDENTCRKNFTPSEALAMGKAIEELERPRAKARQEATRAKKGEQAHKRNRAAQGGGNLPPPQESGGKTRDKVAEAVGMSGRTYEKAKAVAEAARADPETCGDLPEMMDQSGNVHGAYQEMKQRRDTAIALDLCQQPVPPDRKGVFLESRRLNEVCQQLDDVARVVKTVADTVDRQCYGVDLADTLKGVATRAREMKREIRDHQPYAVCPTCRGDDSGECDDCEFNGWVNRQVYKRLCPKGQPGATQEPAESPCGRSQGT